jgi:hypothetical protein
VAIEVCKLCLQAKELRDSHYIPRRAYSMNMAKSLANPNPVVVSHGKVRQVCDQLRGHTFCGGCEQMLSAKGEKWVLANVPADQGDPFPLQEAIIPETPVCSKEVVDVYAGRTIKAFDMDKLIYFGMSIFWRGAARQWKSSLGGIAPAVDVGNSFEPMRKYLLGGPFPDDCSLLVFIYNWKPAMNAATVVFKEDGPFGEFHWFYLNGLGFSLFVGNVHKSVRQLCAWHSADGYILVDRRFGDMVRQVLKEQMLGNERSENLEKFLKGPDPRKKPQG